MGTLAGSTGAAVGALVEATGAAVGGLGALAPMVVLVAEAPGAAVGALVVGAVARGAAVVALGVEAGAAMGPLVVEAAGECWPGAGPTGSPLGLRLHRQANATQGSLGWPAGPHRGAVCLS